MPKRLIIELPTYLLNDNILEGFVEKAESYQADMPPCSRCANFISQVKEELRYRRGTVTLEEDGFKQTPVTEN